MDLVTLLRRSHKKSYVNFPELLNVNLHRLRYVMLFALLILPVVAVGPSGYRALAFGCLLVRSFQAAWNLVGTYGARNYPLESAIRSKL
jgi:hypothetical protein